jgi:hypothetical protein
MNLDSLADCPAVPRLLQRVRLNTEGKRVGFEHDTNMGRAGPGR